MKVRGFKFPPKRGPRDQDTTVFVKTGPPKMDFGREAVGEKWFNLGNSKYESFLT